MKKVTLFAVALTAFAALFSCGNKNQYTINGHLEADGFDSTMVYLYNVGTNELIDSTILANGMFTFTGMVNEPFVARISTIRNENNMSYYGICFPEAGEIYIDLFTDSLSGTPLNDSYYKFSTNPQLAQRNEELSFILTLWREASSEDRPKVKVERAFDSIENLLNQETKALAQELYQGHKEDVLGAFAMNILVGQCETLSEVQALLKDVNPIVAQYQPTVEILDRLQCVENTKVGKHYTDVEAITMTGEPTKLSALIDGKLAIVDFWASWCSPCRAEIKDNLINIASKYEGKLMVVGIDVWDKIPNHAKAVEELGITYPQIIDTTRNSTSVYGIEGIPHIMLISPEGTILARDLRGHDIEEAIEKALAE